MLGVLVVPSLGWSPCGGLWAPRVLLSRSAVTPRMCTPQDEDGAAVKKAMVLETARVKAMALETSLTRPEPTTTSTAG